MGISPLAAALEKLLGIRVQIDAFERNQPFFTNVAMTLDASAARFVFALEDGSFVARGRMPLHLAKKVQEEIEGRTRKPYNGRLVAPQSWTVNAKGELTIVAAPTNYYAALAANFSLERSGEVLEQSLIRQSPTTSPLANFLCVQAMLITSDEHVVWSRRGRTAIAADMYGPAAGGLVETGGLSTESDWPDCVDIKPPDLVAELLREASEEIGSKLPLQTPSYSALSIMQDVEPARLKPSGHIAFTLTGVIATPWTSAQVIAHKDQTDGEVAKLLSAPCATAADWRNLLAAVKEENSSWTAAGLLGLTYAFASRIGEADVVAGLQEASWLPAARSAYLLDRRRSAQTVDLEKRLT